MGTSYSAYKGMGFWSRDEVLEFWLSAASQAMEPAASLEQFAAILKDDWLESSRAGGVGCTSPELDKFLPDRRQVEYILPFLYQALQRIREFGEFIPKKELSDNRISNLTDWWQEDSVR